MNDRPTILIVDDDNAGREAIRGVLVSQDYHLLEAVDGQSALDLAQEHIPDLILLDVMMPGLDGYEVCRRMRADPVLSEMPILMLTALDDRASRLRGIDVGADDFITKPYDRVELRARVRTITRLNRYRHLLLERARFVWVIENDQDGYLILDDAGNIDFANAAARALLHLPDPDEERRPAPVSFAARVQEQYVCIPPERWSQWPTVDDLREPLYFLRPQDDASRPLWFEVHCLDLPWLTRSQRLLRIKDVSQTFSLALETWAFQSAARHKLITPVSNMSLSIELIKALSKNQPFSDDVRDCLDTIEISTRRLEQEVRDVLEYINAPFIIQSGELTRLSELEPILLQAAAELGLEGLTCALEPDALDAQTLPLSRRALQMLLWQVLENARKFHPRLAPSVAVRLSRTQAGEICLTITDDGVWIPFEHLDQVLRPYYQAEKTYTGEVTGMGLGLPTAAVLVWQAGGSIRLYNRPDCPGVVVEIRFQAAR